MLNQGPFLTTNFKDFDISSPPSINPQEISQVQIVGFNFFFIFNINMFSPCVREGKYSGKKLCYFFKTVTRVKTLFFLENVKLRLDQDLEISEFETYVIVCNIYLISCIFSENGGRWPPKHLFMIIKI